MAAPQIIEADVTWTGHRFEPSIQVVTSNGLVERLGALGLVPTKKLSGKALLPGMVNVHSHAFQRGLRGSGDLFSDGSGNFWSWREAMYKLASELDAEKFAHLCRQAFSEMLTAGITTVGEFHYLHHSGSEENYAMDAAIVRAAQDVGIRLVLLSAFYNTGGVNKPLSENQQQFKTDSVEAYWDQWDELCSHLDENTQTLGVAAHSVRAASLADIGQLHRDACRRKLPFHMHVEEQRKEVEEFRADFGRTPMSMLTQELDVSANFTAVHCTHTSAEDMEQYLAAGGNVCICPLTEANLGDGIPATPDIVAAGGRICIGTDSNSRISFSEELRWLEYVQRLHQEKRGVLVGETGNVARNLFEMATVNGARSLNVQSGEISPGFNADFVTLDLTAPELRGADPDTLLEAFIFGCGNSVIADRCVAGRWL